MGPLWDMKAWCMFNAQKRDHMSHYNHLSALMTFASPHWPRCPWILTSECGWACHCSPRLMALDMHFNLQNWFLSLYGPTTERAFSAHSVCASPRDISCWNIMRGFWQVSQSIPRSSAFSDGIDELLRSKNAREDKRFHSERPFSSGRARTSWIKSIVSVAFGTRTSHFALNKPKTKKS